MSKLDAVFRLTHSVAVFVPSTVKVDQAVDSTEVVKDTIDKLSKLFGGCTAYTAKGAWVSADAGLVVEDVIVCQSYAQTLDDEALDAVYNIADEIKRQMAQEAVSVAVDGAIYFV